uniref:DUF3019 domain-containing protein n=1 Tax=Macrostomum lignano TaxID=282301 RepID=A0A1I8GE99_9PLAT
MHLWRSLFSILPIILLSIGSAEQLDHRSRQLLMRTVLNLAGHGNYSCRSVLSSELVEVAPAAERVHLGERQLTLVLRLTGCRSLIRPGGNDSGWLIDSEDSDEARKFIFHGNSNSEERTSAAITLKQTVVFTVCGAIISAFFLVAAILRFR